MDKEVYTVQELAAKMGLSRQTITRLFEKERGVLVLDRPAKLHKRGFRSIRIPREVYLRVRHRHTLRKRKR